MKVIKYFLIIAGIFSIFFSFYISTLIYTNYTIGNSHFIAEFKNINYNIYELPEYSYIEFPTWTFNRTENATLVLTRDLQSKINFNIGTLSCDQSQYYFAFSKEPIEDGLYAVDEIYEHRLGSLKGTSTILFEIIYFTKADQTFLMWQKIYKISSVFFFIIGIAFISLYILINDLNAKGKLLTTRGSFEDAIKSFRKTLGINPEDETALMNIGYILNFTEKFDEADIYYDKAIKLYPKSAWIWYYKGLSYFKRKDYEESNKCFEKAIELYPEYSEAYYDRACVFSLKNDADKAIQSLKKAIELSKIKYILHAKDDKDFDNIRDKEEFINLIKYT